VARVGSFLGPTQAYGAPLSVVHPSDNDFTKSKYHPSLLDPKLKLTQEELDEIQKEILELLRTLQVGRDLP
jgi:hypothetical protein